MLSSPWEPRPTGTTGTTMFSQSLRSASRPLLRSVVHRKPPSLLSQHRNFTQTRAWKASEDVSTFAAQYQNTALFKKLADKPAALSALNDFAQILKDEGSLRSRWFRTRWVGVLTLGFRNRHRPHKWPATLQVANVQTGHELKVQGRREEGCRRVAECWDRFVFQGASPRFRLLCSPATYLLLPRLQEAMEELTDFSRWAKK